MLCVFFGGGGGWGREGAKHSTEPDVVLFLFCSSDNLPSSPSNLFEDVGARVHAKPLERGGGRYCNCLGKHFDMNKWKRLGRWETPRERPWEFSRTCKGGFRGGGLWGLQPPQMILRSPAHLGLKYDSRPVFLTGA